MKIDGFENWEVKNADKVTQIFKAILEAENHVDQDKEHFWTVGLNQRNGIKYIELVSLGTLNAALVHPREVFRMAIFEGIGGLIIVHNHPSKNPEPSDDDLTIAKKLQMAGEIIGIKVMDSIIMTISGKYYSWKENGIF
jgi:DNA repair protein RadC